MGENLILFGNNYSNINKIKIMGQNNSWIEYDLNNTLLMDVVEMVNDKNYGSIVENNASKIRDAAFYNNNKLTIASFPECEYIGNYAFVNCYSLTSISLPECSYIGGYAFYSCSSLTSILFPKCSYIGYSAFYYCYSLTSIYLNYSLVCSLYHSNVFNSTPIGGYTEYTNGQLGSIYVPASLVESYKTANNWSYYSDRITSIK